jgi:hypothetical protein
MTVTILVARGRPISTCYADHKSFGGFDCRHWLRFSTTGRGDMTRNVGIAIFLA